MVRTYVRNGKKVRRSGPVLLKAIRQHMAKGVSIHGVAKSTGIPYSTIQRLVSKLKNSEELSFDQRTHAMQVFNEAQEAEICNYLTQCASMCFGITPMRLKEFAFEIAERNKLKFPKSRVEQKRAGDDWYSAFMKRNPTVSVRQPEHCSLARAIGFNPSAVTLFHSNLERVFEKDARLKNPKRIYNLDEIGTSTVPNRSTKVLAKKGCKQINQILSLERGVLVTTCCIISANGQFLPPAMVFPRVNFNPKMLKNGPLDTLGLTEKSGWMTSVNFEKVMGHFIKHSASSPDNPSLLIYDNHASHMSLDVIDLAKKNGVTILTLPPHSSHKLQPLDVAINFGLRRAFTKALNSMVTKLGGPVTIYEVAECVSTAIDAAMTPVNIKNGFEATGIYPFNKKVFTRKDFEPTQFSDRPAPEVPQQDINASKKGNAHTEKAPQKEPNVSVQSRTTPEKVLRHEPNVSNECNTTPELQASKISCVTPNQVKSPNQPSTSSSVFSDSASPKDILPLPKAKERDPNQPKRETGRSIVATDTPEKNKIEAKLRGRELKKMEKENKKKPRALEKAAKTVQKLLQPNKKRRQMKNLAAKETDI